MASWSLPLLLSVVVQVLRSVLSPAPVLWLPALLAQADFIVVAVPTPVDAERRPDFGPLISASETVGRHMKRGAIVVYDAVTLKEVKRLPMRKPVGKYNVYNKITRSEGTSH